MLHGGLIVKEPCLGMSYKTSITTISMCLYPCRQQCNVIHMDLKPHAKKPPPPVPRSKSVSSSTSQFHSTKGRQHYSSIHGGHGLPPAVGHINTATVAPSSASTRQMSPQWANHGNVTEAVYDSPELCAGHTSDEIHTQSNPSYAEVSMPPTGIATTDVEISYSESHSLQ